VGIDAAVNSYGFAVSHACARDGGFRNNTAFLNLRVYRRILAEKCPDCEEAKLFISKYSFSSGADNLIYLDKNGHALVAEKLPSDVEFRYPEKNSIFCTGRFLSSKISKLTEQIEYEKKDQEVKKLINRENYIQKMIEDNTSNLSLELMKNILCCRDRDIEICNKHSNWAAILMPDNFELLLTDRYPGDEEFKSIL
jgi:hypothetical protein